MSEKFEKLSRLLERAAALQTAMVLFEWDNETLAPREAAGHTARMIGSLSEQYLEIMTSGEMEECLKACREEEGLNEVQAAIVREVEEEISRWKDIPAAEYRAFRELVSRATGIWARARENNDFAAFAPVLEEIINCQKRFAACRAGEGQSLYDVMLSDYEKGFDTRILDDFFRQLRENIVPLLREASKRSECIPTDFLAADYPVAAQEKAAHFLAEYLGFSFDRGVLAVSAHPFTTNLHNHDVRITTHYGKRIDSSIFSVIHETGHALYELGIRDDLTQTPVGQGASMGMHECQSRFYENIIGRSRAFWEPVYGKMGEIFGEPLASTPLDDFMAAVNRTVPGLIRTEADELSYGLHILVRYEIEKMLMEGSLDVKDLPEVWNGKYREYLGICPENDSQGVLQDIHWSQGSFGYFPSYALGSAFGAQIYYHMKKEIPVEDLLREGKLKNITEYLRERIHQYGKLKDSRTLLREVTGEDFSPGYYIRYLNEKYGV